MSDFATTNAIVTAIPEAVLALDPDENVTWANPAAVSLFGYALDELRGTPISELLAEEELLVLTGLRCAFTPGATSDLNILFRSRDGTLLPTTTTGKLTSESLTDEPSSLILVIRDERRMYALLTQASKEIVAERERLSSASEALRVAVEKRKLAEVELRHAQKLRAVGQLAAGIAHEINTPLQFVSDSICFLQDAVGDLFGLLDSYAGLVDAVAIGQPAGTLVDDIRAIEVERDLDFIRAEAPAAFLRTLEGLERVGSIVRAMREFAHPAVDRTEVDINGVVLNSLTVVRNEYRLVADVRTELGQLPIVACSKGEIGQVVVNVVINAAHAIRDVMEQSGQRGTITVATRHEGEYVAIEVSDTGTGIAEDIRDRIFEPFFTTKQVGEGTGQGLAISHAIIQRHAGTISVDSQRGRGTTFIVRIPVQGCVEA